MEPLERLERSDDIQQAPIVAAEQEAAVRWRVDPRTGKLPTLHGAAFLQARHRRHGCSPMSRRKASHWPGEVSDDTAENRSDR